MRAVLYCRVSTADQVQNLSLTTQEEACREYCNRHSYDVDAVFVDAGESAKTADRTEFKKMLAHCQRGRGRLHAVVVYSLTRFSRNNTDHHAIAAALRGLGIALRSVTEPIDDTPSGRLMEGILASMAQFDNDVRSERVTAGMKAAVDRGRWVWPAPLGYLNGRRGGPSLVPDPDRAAAVREAFALCARGIVGAALLQRVRAMRLTTKQGRPVSQSRLYELLRQPVYAGVVRTAVWQKDHRGDFEALVDAATFARVQAQLTRRREVPPPAPAPRGRPPKDERQLARGNDGQFPLRRFATCTTCGRPLTASISRGRNGARYAFYHCIPGCVRLPKAAFEQQFVELLDTLRPHPALWKVFRHRVLDGWRAELQALRDRRGAARRRLADLETKLARLEDAFIYHQAIDQPTYFARRDKLRADIAIETLETSAASEETLDVEGMLAYAETVLAKAGALWTSTCTTSRIQLQWALFPGGVRVAENGIIEPSNVLGFLPVSVARPAEKGLVDHPGPTWKQARPWLTGLFNWKAA